MAIIVNPTTVIQGGGSSDVVNGVVKQYKATSATIDAGTFVEFVNSGTFTAGTDTQVSTVAQTGSHISATQLDDNRVFIAHSYGANLHLYGIVCTISGTTITLGTDTPISTTAYAGYAISAVRLDGDRVFIAHSYDSTNYYLYGVVCAVSGTTITFGSDDALNNTTAYSGYRISAERVSDDKVVVVHGTSSTSSSSKLYGTLCTISGTAITVGSDTRLDASTSAGAFFSTSSLSDSNVVIVYKHSGNGPLYYKVCTVNGTNLSVIFSGSLVTSLTETAPASVVALNDTSFFVAYNDSSSTTGAGYLKGIVCSQASSGAFSAGPSATIDNTAYSGRYAISATLLDDGNVFVAYSQNATNYYVYGAICTIKGIMVTAGQGIQLSTTTTTGEEISTALLSSGDVFIGHSRDTSPYLQGAVADMSGTISAQAATYPDKIRGLTGESISSSTAGDVWVLDTSSER